MAKETVQAVKNAELSAIQIEKDAACQKEAILSQAVQDAKAIVTSMTSKALEKAEQDLQAATQEGEELIEAAKADMKKDVLQLAKNVKEKEKSAIELVISHMV